MDDNSTEKKLISNTLMVKSLKMHLIINQMIKTNKDLLEFISPKNWIDQINNKYSSCMEQMTYGSIYRVYFSTSKFKNSTLLISFYMNIKKYQPTRNIF